MSAPKTETVESGKDFDIPIEIPIGAGAGGGDGAAGGMMLLCLFVCCLCPFLALYIAYITFGIIFLVQDINVCGYEPQIWSWGVSVLVVPCFTMIIVQMIQNPIAKAVAIPLLNIPLIVFGALVLYDTSYSGYVCDAMKSEGLYIWALVAFWWLVVMTTISSLFVCCFGIFLIFHPELAEQMNNMGQPPMTAPTEQDKAETDPLLPKGKELDLESQTHSKPHDEPSKALDIPANLPEEHHKPVPHHPDDIDETHREESYASHDHHEPSMHAPEDAPHPQGFHQPSEHDGERTPSRRTDEHRTWEEVHTPHQPLDSYLD